MLLLLRMMWKMMMMEMVVALIVQMMRLLQLRMHGRSLHRIHMAHVASNAAAAVCAVRWSGNLHNVAAVFSDAAADDDVAAVESLIFHGLLGLVAMILEPDFHLGRRQAQTVGEHLALRRAQVPRLAETLLQFVHLCLCKQNATLSLRSATTTSATAAATASISLTTALIVERRDYVARDAARGTVVHQ